MEIVVVVGAVENVDIPDIPVCDSIFTLLCLWIYGGMACDKMWKHFFIIL